MFIDLRTTIAVAAVSAVLSAMIGCRPAADVPVERPAGGSSASLNEPAEEIPPPAVEEDIPEPAAESSSQVAPVEPETVAETGLDDTPVVAAETEEGVEAVAPAEEEMPLVEAVRSGAPAEEAEGEEPDPPALPVPLVDDPESLTLLHPVYPVWIDRERTHVVMVGRVCQRRAPLELFACMEGSKEHESVVSVNTKAYVMHAALQAVRANPGSPVAFEPEYRPPTGPEIEITVIWQDESGRRRRARAQDWVRDVGGLYERFDGVIANQFDDELNLTDQFAAWKSMEQPWVFAGSRFVEDDETGKQSYLADVEGELICVSNFSSAVLDVPIRSSGSNASLLFETYTERIPPLGTPVTLVLEPKLGEEGQAVGGRL